ncbi:MAG: hypothetical protein ACXADX_16650, partial [Candidatus Hodarchaeales archaeon]
MSIDETKKKPKTWTKRVVTALMPPMATSITLLAGLGIVSIAIVTIGIGFLASIYSRRLSAYSSSSTPQLQQGDLVEIFANKSNVVMYRTPEGPQIMAFYQVVRRPSDYSFHALRATLGNSNLTVHPIIHANGPFLCIRFSDNGSSNQKDFVWDVPRHLEGLILSITQKTPGLELAPASLTDLKDLLGVFGLRIKERQDRSVQVSGSSDHLQPRRDRSRDPSDQVSKRIIRNGPQIQSKNDPKAARALSEVARGIFESNKAAKEEKTAIEHMVAN